MVREDLSWVSGRHGTYKVTSCLKLLESRQKDQKFHTIVSNFF